MSLLAVNHHYFREHAPGSGIYPISSALLQERVRTLRSRYRIADQAMLVKVLNGEHPDIDLCLITFDDGLKEPVHAVEFLQSLGCDAICFVPTTPIVRKIVLDVHKLHMVRSVANDAALVVELKRFGFDRVEWNEEHLRTQYRYDSDESRKVKYFLNFILDEAQRREWLDEAFASRFGNEMAASEALYMSQDELRALARKGRLGTHGSNHVPLATLSGKALQSEIGGSIEVLEHITGTRMLGISYPFGGKSAVSDEVFSTAKSCGLRYGFTMERGINGHADYVLPMKLKRIDTNDVTDIMASAA